MADKAKLLEPALTQARGLYLIATLCGVLTLFCIVFATYFILLRKRQVHVEKDESFIGRLVNNKSDLEIENVLQKFSSVTSLIFAALGYVISYASDVRQKIRLVLGLVALANQIYTINWIYVETWGEAASTTMGSVAIITGALAAQSISSCRSFDCLTSGETILYTAVYYFIILSVITNSIFAAVFLTGIFSTNPNKENDRIRINLAGSTWECEKEINDFKFGQHYDDPVDYLIGDLVDIILVDKNKKHIREKIYKGEKLTMSRTAIALVPPIAIAIDSIIYSHEQFPSASYAAAVLYLIAACATFSLSIVCVHSRERRVPICFGRLSDISEAFENATADLLGMEQSEVREIVYGENFDWDKGCLSRLVDHQDKGNIKLLLDGETIDYMTIQALGITELGHYTENTNPNYVNPNDNEELRKIKDIPVNWEGLEARRNLIWQAISERDPMLLGPIAFSKVTGIVMAMRNMEYYLKRNHGNIIEPQSNV